jgi:hypothetical protein
MDYTIPVSTLKASLFTMAKKDVRFYLNGAFLDFRKGRIVSTDGHCLFCGQIPYADHDPVIIPREVIEQTVKSVGKRGLSWAADMSIESGAVKITVPGAMFCANLVDGKFPEYERIVSVNPSGESAQFDPNILLACYEAIAAYTTAGRAYPMLYPNGSSGAIYAQSGTDAFCVVMPWRAGGELDLAWFTGKPDMQVAA